MAAFGDEIKGGSEAELHLDLGQTLTLGNANGAFDVVSDDKGEFFVLWPA